MNYRFCQFNTIHIGRGCLAAVFLTASMLGNVRVTFAGVSVSEQPPPSSAVAKPILPRGMWVWSKNSWFEPSARGEMFGLCKRHGISVILLQIHTDYSGPRPKLKYTEQLSALLQQASQEGVVVHALDGGPEMVFPPWPQKLAGQIQAIDEFNSTQTANARFVGVHYDIEPYLLPEWKKDWDSRLEVCRGYLTTLQALASIARSHNLEFSVDIPPWFETSDNLKPFDFMGHSGTLLEFVARIVDWFGIMAYRNHASGPDGILSVSEPNIKVMEKLGKKAWVGVETGENKGGDPPKITFYGHPPTELDQALREVDTTLSSRKSYGGTLIHCYEKYREYLAKAPQD